MKNFVQPGNSIPLTAPSGGVTSGSGIVIGSLFGVAAFSADVGASVEIVTTGVFTLPKATSGDSAEALSEGELVYWDSANGNVTTTAGGNTLIGVAIKAAANSATTARVRLNGTAG